MTKDTYIEKEINNINEHFKNNAESIVMSIVKDICAVIYSNNPRIISAYFHLFYAIYEHANITTIVINEYKKNNSYLRIIIPIVPGIDKSFVCEVLLPLKPINQSCFIELELLMFRKNYHYDELRHVVEFIVINTDRLINNIEHYEQEQHSDIINIDNIENSTEIKRIDYDGKRIFYMFENTLF